MITLGEEHRLGPTAFIILVWKRSAAGLVLFLCGIVAAALEPNILAGINSGLANMSENVPVAAIAAYVHMIISALFILALLIIFVGIIVGFMEYRFYSFRFDEFDLVVRRGILRRREVSIPYRQMQDINIDRGLLHQVLGVSRVVIDSAGHEEEHERNETDVILDPIARVEAEDIRTFLQRRIGVQVVVDEKVADAKVS